MSRKSTMLLAAGLLAVATGLAAGMLPALAAGGDSGGGGGGSGGSGDGAQPIVCRKGWTYDATKKICVRNESLNDEQLYQQGRALALAGNYEDALDTLNAVRNRSDAMVLTMIGYSTRKLGRLDEGIAIYHQALAIDPNNINTREYLGEGYVAAGRKDLAMLELAKLETLCGQQCEQYEDLANAIAGKAE